jgi:2-oxoacid:acceptor oxidoreductase delta subunit (pyruvate/2-ketoisovalerate family)
MKKQNKIDFGSLKSKIGNVEITIGAVLESTGSTSKTKTGAWRSLKPVVDEKKCIGCGMCWTYCPEGGVEKKGEKKFSVNYDYCKGCGICANECPKKAVSMVMEEK